MFSNEEQNSYNVLLESISVALMLIEMKEYLKSIFPKDKQFILIEKSLKRLIMLTFQLK